jgi:hypothetical protein
MSALNKKNAIAGLLLALGLHHTVFAQSPPTNAWRRSDAALLQVCFDKLDGEPPKSLPVTVISETTLAGKTLELIAYTSTKRPIYQGNLTHPSSFQSALVTLPGSQVVVKVDRPANFETYIDIWKNAPSDTCFSDTSFAFRMLGNGKPSPDVTCPDLGVSTSLKVASGSEHALDIRDARAKGPAEFNGLRGCREPAYPPRKGT